MTETFLFHYPVREITDAIREAYGYVTYEILMDTENLDLMKGGNSLWLEGTKWHLGRQSKSVGKQPDFEFI